MTVNITAEKSDICLQLVLVGLQGVQLYRDVVLIARIDPVAIRIVMPTNVTCHRDCEGHQHGTAIELPLQG